MPHSCFFPSSIRNYSRRDLILAGRRVRLDDQVEGRSDTTDATDFSPLTILVVRARPSKDGEPSGADHEPLLIAAPLTFSLLLHLHVRATFFLLSIAHLPIYSTPPPFLSSTALSPFVCTHGSICHTHPSDMPSPLPLFSTGLWPPPAPAQSSRELQLEEVGFEL